MRLIAFPVHEFTTACAVISRTARDISFYFEIKHNKANVVSVSNKKNHERIKLLCDVKLVNLVKLIIFRIRFRQKIYKCHAVRLKGQTQNITSTDQFKILFGAMRIQTFTRSNWIVCESSPVITQSCWSTSVLIFFSDRKMARTVLLRWRNDKRFSAFSISFNNYCFDTLLVLASKAYISL